MNPLLDETDDREDRSHRSQGEDREITLGTTMILLIFFALAVYGAVLFGFGYSLGSKHSGNTPVAVAAAPTAAPSFNTFKPAPGSPVGAPAPGKVPATADDFVAPVVAPGKNNTPPAKAIVDAGGAEESGAKVRTPTPTASTNSAPTAAATPMPVAGTGNVVVQVAAVSHQEDADLIASTLKRRGYVVNIRTEADKLIHVQVGPFATRKDAEVMKAKLLADGFNAYIK